MYNLARVLFFESNNRRVPAPSLWSPYLESYLRETASSVKVGPLPLACPAVSVAVLAMHRPGCSYEWACACVATRKQGKKDSVKVDVPVLFAICLRGTPLVTYAAQHLDWRWWLHLFILVVIVTVVHVLQWQKSNSMSTENSRGRKVFSIDALHLLRLQLQAPPSLPFPLVKLSLEWVRRRLVSVAAFCVPCLRAAAWSSSSGS